MRYVTLETKQIILQQLNALLSKYDIDIYDVSTIGEYAYRERYSELYHVIKEHPSKYLFEILSMD